MDNCNQLTPVYSYQKFKELADDRMSQVKIFIQTADSWESAGSGTIQFFQIEPTNCLKEIKTGEDFNPRIQNLYLLIEAADVNELALQERQTLHRNSDVFKTKDIGFNNVIVFYDLTLGIDFEYDIESSFIRESDQLGPS